MRRLVETAGAILALALFAAFFAFVIINFLLGCETWDQSYWTEYNSCITPTMIWEGITQ